LKAEDDEINLVEPILKYKRNKRDSNTEKSNRNVRIYNELNQNSND